MHLSCREAKTYHLFSRLERQFLQRARRLLFEQSDQQEREKGEAKRHLSPLELDLRRERNRRQPRRIEVVRDGFNIDQDYFVLFRRVVLTWRERNLFGFLVVECTLKGEIQECVQREREVFTFYSIVYRSSNARGEFRRCQEFHRYLEFCVEWVFPRI